jgi:hypothetical protein
MIALIIATDIANRNSNSCHSFNLHASCSTTGITGASYAVAEADTLTVYTYPGTLLAKPTFGSKRRPPLLPNGSLLRST